ncbi:hypothetical protein QUB80_06095 [Chlorogloeopsis sp. ULAP01]|uniref:hypothetical protein n=1 Tax=Chlorogloeopsis sp. ULAP01 TaxID=3056483 RepID=UPI0025AACBDC|nr:hypothetical protein [Chlorogloeopsis sp. ULAP01]MDM9380273.1 hypothetical protein [Chlorogloeopsis sp. ULAP01]
MTSFESNSSKNCEADGIQMEISEPNLVALPIPDQRDTNTCLQIDIGITNKTPTTFPFVYELLTPEFLSPDGQVLHPQKLINTQPPSRYNGMGIPYQKTLGCYLIAKFCWQNNLLQLQATILHSSKPPINPNYFWFFEALQLGAYKLKLTYLSPQEEFLFFDAHTGEITSIQASVTSLLATPWVNFQLVEPMGSNHNQVQVNNVCFETVVPEQIWTISHSQLSDAGSSVQIGLRITNNTSISQCFCSFTTLIPALMGADGCILGQNLGAGSTGWVGPGESDYHLVEPGKSVMFFVSAHIERQTDGLLSLIVRGTGRGYWSFNSLELGIYQVRLAYRSLTNPLDIGSLEDFWRGMVHTPFVEFCLVQA